MKEKTKKDTTKKVVGVDALVRQLLEECKKIGYTNVVLNMRHKIVPQSLTHSFDAFGNVFAHPEKDIDGWPAIWRITEKLKIGSGCGNSHQHQINKPRELSAWHYNKNKGWQKVA